MIKKIIGSIPAIKNLLITADLHLGDDRMQILGRRFSGKEEAADAMLKNIKGCLQPDDTLLIVGDAAMTDEWLVRLAELECPKILVRGNKDYLSDGAFEAAGFTMIVEEGLYIGERYYAVHYPSRAVSDRFNIVGHVHHAYRVQKNMLNVGVDCNHFFPLRLTDVDFAVSAISGFYDDDVWVGDHEANSSHRYRGKIGKYNTKPVLREGDLLESDHPILHQCNCEFSGADSCGGIARVIFSRYPWALPSRSQMKLGGYSVHNNPYQDGPPVIINAYGQLHGGRPSESDSAESRREAFRSSISTLLREKAFDKVSMPYRIGCAIAGGDWNEYYKIISDIGAENPRTALHLCKLPEETW